MDDRTRKRSTRERRELAIEQNPERLVRPDEAARLLGGIHTSTVRRLVARGLMPSPMRLGHRISAWPLHQVLEARERIAEHFAGGAR